MDKNKDGMHQIHDVKIIERVGREKQRYDENHNRLCAGYVLRPVLALFPLFLYTFFLLFSLSSVLLSFYAY